MKEERDNMVIVAFIILTALMLTGFGVLGLWIRNLRAELGYMKTDHKKDMEAVYQMHSDVNEDLLNLQVEVTGIDTELSETKVIQKNTNQALNRLRKSLAITSQEPRKEEQTTEQPKRKEETMHEVFPEEEARIIADAAPAYEEPEAPSSTSDGVFEITAYTWTGNPCANGEYPIDGITVASNYYPIGTRLYIEGLGERVVQDTGGMSSNVIDVYMGSEAECIQWGRQTANVYVIE